MGVQEQTFAELITRTNKIFEKIYQIDRKLRKIEARLEEIQLRLGGNGYAGGED